MLVFTQVVENGNGLSGTCQEHGPRGSAFAAFDGFDASTSGDDLETSLSLYPFLLWENFWTLIIDDIVTNHNL